MGLLLLMAGSEPRVKAGGWIIRFLLRFYVLCIGPVANEEGRVRKCPLCVSVAWVEGRCGTNTSIMIALRYRGQG